MARAQLEMLRDFRPLLADPDLAPHPHDRLTPVILRLNPRVVWIVNLTGFSGEKPLWQAGFLPVQSHTLTEGSKAAAGASSVAIGTNSSAAGRRSPLCDRVIGRETDVAVEHRRCR
jgi:hypothetical protein